MNGFAEVVLTQGTQWITKRTQFLKGNTKYVCDCRLLLEFKLISAQNKTQLFNFYSSREHSKPDIYQRCLTLKYWVIKRLFRKKTLRHLRLTKQYSNETYSTTFSCHLHFRLC